MLKGEGTAVIVFGGLELPEGPHPDGRGPDAAVLALYPLEARLRRCKAV